MKHSDGAPIEKGVVLTRDFLEKNQALFKRYLNHWMLNPDLFLDTIQTETDKKHFTLKPYQRLMLRAVMRYRYVFFTATRAASKSFCAYLGAYLKCMFLPNSNIFIASDIKGTVIKTAEAKFAEFFRHWPLLQNELKTQEDDGKKGQKSSNSYYELNFKNGSKLTVIAKDTSRGLRATCGIFEEAMTIDEVNFNEVLVPQLNIPRRCADGSLNPEEPVSSQIFITTARERTVFMYSKLIEVTINAVLYPKSYFSFGVSYEAPLYYGVINKQMLIDQRDSTTVSDEAFLRENLSVYTGNNAEAWLDSKKLNKRRTLLKCERAASFNEKNPDAFYIFGVDICLAC